MTGKLNTEHLDENEVLAWLYAEEDGRVSQHMAECASCREHAGHLRAQRALFEEQYPAGEEVNFEFLAAQRRSIYARIDRQQRAGWLFAMQRWVTAGSLATALIAGVVLVEQHYTQDRQPSISDSQLAAEVNQFANDSTPPPTQPITALFSE